MNTQTQTSSRKVTSIILGLIVIGIVVYLLWKPAPQANAPIDTTPTAVITGNAADLVALSIQPGATLTGTVTVTGTLKNAYFFEANARGMLLDANRNVIVSFPIAATEDWMTAEPIDFTTTFDTSAAPKGPGYFRIMNDNPSGEPANDKTIDIPVVFQ